MLVNKEITSVELTEDGLARNDEVEGDVKAYLTITRDEALAQAKAVNTYAPAVMFDRTHFSSSNPAPVMSVGQVSELRDYLAQAKAVDEKIARGEEISFLEGIPGAIKDNICTTTITTATKQPLSTWVLSAPLLPICGAIPSLSMPRMITLSPTISTTPFLTDSLTRTAVWWQSSGNTTHPM